MLLRRLAERSRLRNRLALFAQLSSRPGRAGLQARVQAPFYSCRPERTSAREGPAFPLTLAEHQVEQPAPPPASKAVLRLSGECARQTRGRRARTRRWRKWLRPQHYGTGDSPLQWRSSPASWCVAAMRSQVSASRCIGQQPFWMPQNTSRCRGTGLDNMPDPADIADESPVLAPRAALRAGVFNLPIAENPPGTGSYWRLRVQWRFRTSYVEDVAAALPFTALSSRCRAF